MSLIPGIGNGIFSKASGLRIGLLSVWEMDEASGSTTMIDSYGNNPGAITSMGVGAGGKMGNCYAGTPAGKVTVAHNSDLNPNLGSYTINTWIKWNTGYSIANTICNVLSKGVYNVNGNEIQLTLRGGNTAAYARGVYFRFRNSLGTIQDLTPTYDISNFISNGNWNMISVVVDMNNPTTQASLYVNCSLYGTLGLVTVDINNSAPLIIGQYNGTLPLSAAYIDQTALWKRALTTSELSLIYNATNGLPFNNWQL